MAFIPVTKPFLPEFELYKTMLEDIWARNYLTNNGPLVNKLEKEVSEFLGAVSNKYVTNGTIALQLALRALDVKGEVITTPYSYVATTSSILWEGSEPIFVDVLRNGNINPDLIEAAITENTKAIMATHVYGYPCEIEKIETIAKKHNLKVIYDAAHAFGVKYNKQSIFNFGDASTVSYHATKLFHTVEGGAVFSPNPELLDNIDIKRAFGHRGDVHLDLGINGKQSELHAAMGLVNLPQVNKQISRRREIYNKYLQELGEKLEFVHSQFPENISYNYAYAPVLLPEGSDTENFQKLLADKGVGVRRYFYPSLNTLPYLSKEQKRSCPVSEELANRAICIPIYALLKDSEQEFVIQCLKQSL